MASIPLGSAKALRQASSAFDSPPSLQTRTLCECRNLETIYSETYGSVPLVVSLRCSIPAIRRRLWAEPDRALATCGTGSVQLHRQWELGAKVVTCGPARVQFVRNVWKFLEKRGDPFFWWPRAKIVHTLRVKLAEAIMWAVRLESVVLRQPSRDFTVIQADCMRGGGR